MREDADRWDARYADRAVGEPSPPSGLDGIALPHGGVCVDVACGLGGQSLWAAANGYDVIALDVSATAIAALRTAAADRGFGPRIDARVVDLDEGLPDDVAGRCSLVICQRFRDPRIYAALVDAARPGGVIVLTVLSAAGATTPGPFHASEGELSAAFATLDVEVLRSVEGDGEATLVARRR